MDTINLTINLTIYVCRKQILGWRKWGSKWGPRGVIVFFGCGIGVQKEEGIMNFEY